MALNSSPNYRVLFCLATSALSGGVKVVFDLAERLVLAGHDVQLFSFAGIPRWRHLSVHLLESQDLEEIDFSAYDFVIATNAFFVPLLLPLAGPKVIFYAQDYESFHHGGSTFADLMEESSTFREIYQLPVPVITQSLAVQRLIEERTGRTAFYAPVGLRKELFRSTGTTRRREVARVLLVGNYLMPYKGILDGLSALEALSSRLPVQLVLATQEARNLELFSKYSFSTEVHLRPPEEVMPSLYGGVDVYCCCSWYEGLGLPALEAFCCGIPVVSTRTMGVSDYGVDGYNLLLAAPNDPDDLCRKLEAVLTDDELAALLVEGGRETVRHRYEWAEGVSQFELALDAIAADRGERLLDSRGAQKLLDDLERDGSYTPVTVFRRHQELDDRIADALAEIARAGDPANRVETIRLIRDEVKPYLANPRAQYYRAFRAQFDLCQLVLSVSDRPDLATLAARIGTRKKAHEADPQTPHTVVHRYE